VIVRALLRWPPASFGRWRRGDGEDRSGVLRHEVGVGTQAVTGTFDLDDGGMMQQTIEPGRCHHWIPEHLAPFSKAAVGGEDHGLLLVTYPSGEGRGLIATGA